MIRAYRKYDAKLGQNSDFIVTLITQGAQFEAGNHQSASLRTLWFSKGSVNPPATRLSLQQNPV